jgi:RNA polymerase sigma-70 factor (ECF subfamily)
MKQFLAGNERGFSLLAERYAQPIFAFVFSLIHNADDAEDLVQEVFLKVVKARHSFDTAQKFRPWLYQIARNHCLDFLRKKQRVSGELIDAQEVEASPSATLGQRTIAHRAPSPRDEAITREEHEKVEHALESLDEKARELLHLRFYQGLSYKEISSVLGISENSVGSALIRAVKKLKDSVFTDNGRHK